MNNKRLIILGFLILAVAIVGKLLFCGLKNIKIDDFHPASVIFVIDSSASNQSKLDDEIKYLKNMCSILDPEDTIKILRVSEKSYLIYEGAPTETSAINDTLKEFTKYNQQDYGTAYGEAIKKAFDHALTMKKEGYVPSIVVIGDLENEGDVTKQINWDTLPENVAKIPRLSREDINEKAVLPVNEEVKFCNNEVPGLYHNIFTNKIAYVSLLFKLEALPLEMYPYFTLLNHLLTMLDTKNYSYEQLGYEINKSTGGFNVTRVMFGKYDDASDYTLYSQIRLKVLHDDIQKGIDLAKEVILNTKFDDYKRLKDILLEIKSKKASSFMSSAHIVAVNRANSYINESAKIAEYLAGIDYYKFICSIIDDFDNKKEELVANIKKMLFFVYKKENLVIDIIADKDGYKLFEEGIEGFEDCLYNEEVSFEGDRRIVLYKDNEGITYSGSVQYLARFGNFVKHNLPYDASLKVLKNILSYDFLWNEVRIKGGAYGCMNAFRRNGNGFFVSYRDPNLEETYNNYKNRNVLRVQHFKL